MIRADLMTVQKTLALMSALGGWRRKKEGRERYEVSFCEGGAKISGRRDEALTSPTQMRDP